MNYRKVVEEQIDILRETQSTKLSVAEQCLLAETISNLVSKVGNLPMQKCEPEQK